MNDVCENKSDQTKEKNLLVGFSLSFFFILTQIQIRRLTGPNYRFGTFNRPVPFDIYRKKGNLIGPLVLIWAH